MSPLAKSPLAGRGCFGSSSCFWRRPSSDKLPASTWPNDAANSSSFNEHSFDRISSGGTGARDQVLRQRRCVSLLRCTGGRVCRAHGGRVEGYLPEPGVQASRVPLCCGIRRQEVSGLSSAIVRRCERE